jgi:triacylglycerol lipase
VATFVRRTEELPAIVAQQPFPSVDGCALYIGFLKSAPDRRAQQKLAKYRNDNDDVRVNQREVYWLCRTKMSESAFSGALLEKTLGMASTLRNVTTVRKSPKSIVPAEGRDLPLRYTPQVQVQVRFPILAALLLVAATAYAVEPITITFDEPAIYLNHDVNMFRAQTILHRGVTFRNGYLIQFRDNADAPLNSRMYSSHPGSCHFCNFIQISFPIGATKIVLKAVGGGQEGLEVWDGPISLPTSKLLFKGPKHEWQTIKIDKVGIGPINLYSYTIDFLGKHFPGSVTVDDVTFTPAPPLGDELPAQPVRAPKRPDEAGDTRVVVDTGSGLDTRCSFHGRLRIDVPVKRVVGLVDAGGKLLNPQQLTSSGYLSKTATIKVAAYDVDGPKEVDAVYFNDHRLGNLSGINNGWTENTFTVPIEWVNFGRRAEGDINVEGLNTLRVDIDEANHPLEKWCTSVDWVSLEFDAIAPIFLVHGTNSGPKTWESGVSELLDSVGIPYSNDIQLEPNGTNAENGAILAARVRELADGFGARSCHIVAHSKGGNDTREFLSQHYDPSSLSVLSLYTLSTPFHGTVVADIIEDARSLRGSTSSNAYIAELIARDYSFINTPCCAGITNNTTAYMSKFNLARPVPADVKLYHFAADADLDNDQKISLEERQPIFPDLFFGWFNDLLDEVAEANYFALGTIRKAEVAWKPIKDSTGFTVATVPLLEVVAYNDPFLENDLVVTTSSAQLDPRKYLGQVDANHSRLKSSIIIRGILSRIYADFPIQERTQ